MNFVAKARTSLKRAISNIRSYTNDRGFGVGQTGGSGGAIREAGGSFGKREAAQEDQYFYEKQKKQLADIKKGLSDEIEFHQEQIKRHEEAIRRQKKRLEEIQK